MAIHDKRQAPNAHFSGPSIDELIKKAQDIELAIAALNSDLKRSEHFFATFTALAMVEKSKTAKLAPDSDEMKCLTLLEQYHRIYRCYLKSDLCKEFHKNEHRA